jgi:hypothetical protein
MLGHITDRFADNTQIIKTLQLHQKSQSVIGQFSSQKSQSATDLFGGAGKSQSATDQLSVSSDRFALSLSYLMAMCVSQTRFNGGGGFGDVGGND